MLWRLCVVIVAFASVVFAAQPPATNPRIPLHAGWALENSCKFNATGEKISSPGFDNKSWHRAEVPTTVVAELVADKTFPDPDYGLNLKSFPGMDYSSQTFFANEPMPEDSPFRCGWWYRTEFRVPATYRGKQVWLHLDGVNYRADVWLNGQKIADQKDVAGTFRIFEFDISKFLRTGTNVLAIETFAPTEHDLAITWVDWNPTPPDKDMGLWKDVYLTSSGPVALRHPFVQTKLGADNKSATLTVMADLHNISDRPVKATVHAQIEGIRLQQSVELPASEWKTVKFTAEQFPQLQMKNPRLWWPYQMGSPNLYSAHFSVEVGGKPSDSADVKFGVREVTSEMTPSGRLFKINGRNILVRGGGWASDMLLRWSPEKLRDELRYTKDMGLNTIRLEGKLERNEFYDLADQMGILIMPGWCCCDMWEHWGQWSPETFTIAGDSLKDQVYRLRNHPSVLVWLYGSDNPPPAEVEKMYLKILQDEDWPNPSISSASQQPTSVTGASGVKMTGPYDYVPPVYWLTDTQAGGAHGFNTETSPGPAIPPLESLKRFIPEDHLWPVDQYWNYHAGGERFTSIEKFTHGLDERYGQPTDLTDFLRKSQAMAYEGERAMFEAYARNKYNSTGVIQWMLNNGWPSLIWHLYDYYLVPAGGYFGTKKACEMLHVQYSYDDNSVAVINGYDHPVSRIKAVATLYNLDASNKGGREATLDLAADSSTKAFELPKIDDLDTTYFLRLELQDAAGKKLSDNFYWLSRKPDVMNWAGRADTDYTPQSDFADLTGLNKLPEIKLTATRTIEAGKVTVSLQNPSKSIAFMVALRLAQNGGDVVPIFWEDNYFSLLPGESRTIRGAYDAGRLKGSPVLYVSGWNIAEQQVSAAGARSTRRKKP